VYEDKVQRIHEKFEVARQRIEAKFELAIKTVDGFMAMVVAVFAGMAAIFAAVLKKSVKVLLYCLLLLFVINPVVVGFCLGLCFPGIWGVFISLFSLAMAVSSIVVIVIALRSEPEPQDQPSSQSETWRRPVFLIGLGMNVVVIILCIIYFQISSGTDNFVIAPLHGLYNAVVNFIKTRQQANHPEQTTVLAFSSCIGFMRRLKLYR
jgi:hypothetical protein